MKEIYTIDDIKQFLFREGYFWDGKIGDEQNITVNSFSRPRPVYLTNKHLEKLRLCLQVNEIEFVLYNVERDWEGRIDGYYPFLVFTKDWQKYLLQKYKDDYSEVLINYVNNKGEQIKENLKKELLILKTKADILKEETKRELDELNEIKNQVFEFINSQEF